MAEAETGCASRASRADMRRRKTLDTARRLFAQHGFHAAGVALIARESGVAVGQMYRDFASKEDMVAALVIEDCAEFLKADELMSAISSGDSQSAMTWLLGLLEPKENRQGKGVLIVEIVAECGRNERIAAIFASVQQELRSRVMEALRQIAPGPDREEQRSVVATLLLTFLFGLIHHELTVPELEAEPLLRSMQKIITDQVHAIASA